MFPVSQESDSLSSLEERIQRAVQLVARLRQEKEAAVAEAAEARAEAARAPRKSEDAAGRTKTGSQPDRTAAGTDRRAQRISPAAGGVSEGQMESSVRKNSPSGLPS